MTSRFMGTVFRGIVGMIALAFSAVAVAQAPRPGAAANPKAANAKPAPRTPDGKPDLSGVWVGSQTTGDRFAGQTAGDTTMQLTKWGQEKFNWNRGPQGANVKGVYRGQHVRVELDPVYNCYPPGLVRMGPPLNLPIAFVQMIELVQTPGRLIMLYSYRNSVRHIYTDGREHPKNPEAAWMGHSVGKWDGDTLVVDTVGLRDEAWLDTGGHEFSPELRVVERFRRLDNNTLEIERTLTDPIALAKPFVIRISLKSRPDQDLNENQDGRQYDCTQFMVRKPAFGEGEGGLLGINEPAAGKY